MPEESLTNLKLLFSLVVADDDNFDYSLFGMTRLKIPLVQHIVLIYHIKSGCVEEMWKRKRKKGHVVIKKATREEVFVVLSDEIKRI